MNQFQPQVGWWQASDGQWYPPGGATAADPPLVQIGDITVSSHWVVTPTGTRAVGETSWLVTDLSRSYRALPTWAVIAAIFTFWFFLLGLLFLLVKEDRTEGWIQVTVSAPGFSHTTSLPALSFHTVTDVHNRVNYARSIAAHAQMRG
jgi:hypothetical protein